MLMATGLVLILRKVEISKATSNLSQTKQVLRDSYHEAFLNETTIGSLSPGEFELVEGIHQVRRQSRGIHQTNDLH
jgi:hypothetical protein